MLSNENVIIRFIIHHSTIIISSPGLSVQQASAKIKRGRLKSILAVSSPVQTSKQLSGLITVADYVLRILIFV